MSNEGKRQGEIAMTNIRRALRALDKASDSAWEPANRKCYAAAWSGLYWAEDCTDMALNDSHDRTPDIASRPWRENTSRLLLYMQGVQAGMQLGDVARDELVPDHVRRKHEALDDEWRSIVNDV